MATNTSIIQSVKERERKAFMAIPGMKEYLMASPLDKEKIAAVYPDVTFALMVADSIVGHDREHCAINQKAYFAILDGEKMAEIRFRYETDMKNYIERHLWDD